MAILAGGILGVVGAFSLSLQTAGRADRLEQATAIAARELELAAHLPTERLLEHSGSDECHEWTITYTTKAEGLMSASVEVQWSKQGEPRQYRLSQIFMPRQ